MSEIKHAGYCDFAVDTKCINCERCKWENQKMVVKQSNEEIDNQLSNLRSEWENRLISIDTAHAVSEIPSINIWTGATSRNLGNLEYQKMAQEISQKEFFDMVYGNFENSEYTDNLKLIKTNGKISYFEKNK